MTKIRKIEVEKTKIEGEFMNRKGGKYLKPSLIEYGSVRKLTGKKGTPPEAMGQAFN